MNDEIFSLTTRIERPAAEVAAWHERPGALARLCPPWERVEVVRTDGGVRDGARVTVRSKVGPFWMQWEVEHRGYVAGVEFRDVQLRGPFARWEHRHRFEPDGAKACRLTDEITYRLPGGAVGWALGGGFVRRKLERLFRWRHAVTKADVELAVSGTGLAPRRIVIAGASGLIGRVLVPFLRTQGRAVCTLVRRTPRSAEEIYWNPAAGELAAVALEGVDVIVNLAGENVAGGRWTAARCERIRRSRVDATRTLVKAVQGLARKPAVFVSASAVGFYGDRGDEVLGEDAETGRGFLPEVCRAWETETEGAVSAGVRTVRLRFGVVLTPAGGALGKMLPLFRAGLGGRIGDGRAWLSWVGMDDAVGAIQHAITEPRCEGAVNGVAPTAVTNAAFTATLAQVLRRPAVLPVPVVVLRAAFGRMADETLLASTRATPRALLATGYRFRHAELEEALRHVLGRESGGEASSPRPDGHPSW